jgi:pimeloyl-ACP methyl ester carboxylesterase
VADAGHGIVLERPGLINEIIFEFLDKEGPKISG